MPSIFDLYEKYHDYIDRFSIIRLMGRDRKEIEEKSQGHWNQLWEPKEEEIDQLIIMVRDFISRRIPLVINVNNHYEGSAPLTIESMLKRFY